MSFLFDAAYTGNTVNSGMRHRLLLLLLLTIFAGDFVGFVSIFIKVVIVYLIVINL